jgi:hypothetical protein
MNALDATSHSGIIDHMTTAFVRNDTFGMAMQMRSMLRIRPCSPPAG